MSQNKQTNRDRDIEIEHTEIKTCEVCGNKNLISVLDLGLQPLCDELIMIGDDRVCNEYPIEILLCRKCLTAHQRFQRRHGFGAPEGAGVFRRALAYSFTVDGEGIDPSYLTFFVPLIVVPLISKLTIQTGVREDFFEMLSGRKPVEDDLA